MQFSEVIQNEPSVLEDLDHAMPRESNAQEQVQENKDDIKKSRMVSMMS